LFQLRLVGAVLPGGKKISKGKLRDRLRQHDPERLEMRHIVEHKA